MVLPISTSLLEIAMVFSLISISLLVIFRAFILISSSFSWTSLARSSISFLFVWTSSLIAAKIIHSPSGLKYFLREGKIQRHSYSNRSQPQMEANSKTSLFFLGLLLWSELQILKTSSKLGHLDQHWLT